MTADITNFATQTGATVVGSMTATAAQFNALRIEGLITYGLIDYTFSGAPDFSAVLPGHKLTATGFVNANNNGSGMAIHAVNNTTKVITVKMVERLNSGEDETGASASGTVTTEGSDIKPLSVAKNAQGFVLGEKVSTGHLNWILSTFAVLINNAVTVYQTIATWAAVTRTLDKADLVRGLGWLWFDATATDAAGEGVYAQDSGAGRGFLEVVNPDAMAAMFAAFLPEILPPVSAALTFSSDVATVSVPGAVVGDCVILGPHSSYAGQATGRVSAANTVTIQSSGGSPDGTWSVTVVRPNSMPVITTRGLKIFTNLVGGVYASSAALETDLDIAANEAAFNLLVNSKQHRAVIADGSTIETLVSGSATADAIMTATGGY